MKKILSLVLLSVVIAHATLPTPATLDTSKTYEFGQPLTLSGMSLYTDAGFVYPSVVLADIYAGGGNSGATYLNDYILIFNRGNAAVDINGWSVQYAASSGSTWSVTPLATNSLLLAPGSYYLIQEASSGSNGVMLPVVPDVIGSFNMAVAGGKLALVTDTNILGGTNPRGSRILDFVGWGTANGYQGGGPAPASSGNTTSMQRRSGGCTETFDNLSDFATGTPAPNQRTNLHNCNVSAYLSVSGIPYYTLSSSNAPGEVVWNVPGDVLAGTNIFNITFYTTNVSLITTGSFDAHFSYWTNQTAAGIARTEILENRPFVAASTGQCFTTVSWTNAGPALNGCAVLWSVRLHNDANGFAGLAGCSMKSH